MTMPSGTDPSTQFPPPAPGVTINVNDPAKNDDDPANQFVSRAQMEQILNEERERVRQEEKDKLYPTIEELKAGNKTLMEEREERLAAEAAEQQRLAEEARLAQEAEMDVTTRFDAYKSEMDQRFEAMERQRLIDAQMLEKERAFGQLQAYKAERLAQDAAEIAPEFLDYITGNTPEEIEASIATAKQKTANLVAQFQEAQLGGRRAAAPPIAGAPPVNPADMTGGQDQRTLSAEEIRDMSMAEYSQYRSQLLSAGSQRVRDQGVYAP